VPFGLGTGRRGGGGELADHAGVNDSQPGGFAGIVRQAEDGQKGQDPLLGGQMDPLRAGRVQGPALGEPAVVRHSPFTRFPVGGFPVGGFPASVLPDLPAVGMIFESYHSDSEFRITKRFSTG
jgi:hypothetical protein